MFTPESWCDVDRRALIVASGPSLTGDDVDTAYTLGRSTYVVNDAYKMVPWADVLYACDGDWWDEHERACRDPFLIRWTTNNAAAEKYDLEHIPGRHHDAHPKCYFDTSGDGIIYGGNSGFQALNLAFAHGFRDVVLLGFDMGHRHYEKSHFFGDHPPHLMKPSPFSEWRDTFRRAAPVIKAAGMKVVNATRGGALECFPRVSLDDLI